jgi:hypothetical protein
MQTTQVANVSAVASLAIEKAINSAIDHGLPPPSEAELQKIGDEANRQAVFGFDYKVDRHGNPIQQGIGAWPHNVTLNHLSSIRRYEGQASYERVLKKLWKEAPEVAKRIFAAEPDRIA